MKKQSLSINSDEIRLQSSSKSKTEKVLQKWASDEGEIQEEDIRKAASNYARLEINNRILKWIIVVVIVFLFVLLGFMIASVVIGVNITKDITVKNGALVSNSGNNSIVKTSTMKYKSKITLNSPIEVIDSMKTISITINEGLYNAIVQFDIVSYVYVPGKQLTFYGHTHMADIQPDGTVKYEELIPFDGVKRDSTSGGFASDPYGTHTTNSSNYNEVVINNCTQLLNIASDGHYVLGGNLECTLNSPLLPNDVFTGSLNGAFYTLTINGASLFNSFQGSLFKILIKGNTQGTDQCAVVATNVVAGAIISKVGVYSNLVCSDSGASGSKIAGLYFATVSADPTGQASSITIKGSISQGSISYPSNSALVGAFVGQDANQIVQFTFDAAYLNNITSTGKVAAFANGEIDSVTYGNINFILVNPSSTVNSFPNAFSLTINQNLPYIVNCDSNFCYPTINQVGGLVTPIPDSTSQQSTTCTQ